MNRTNTINELGNFVDLPLEPVNLIIEIIGKESRSTLLIMAHINKTYYGIVRWYAKINKISREILCYEIASEGHLEVLKWAREIGCKWNSDTCSFAAKNGHLEVLKWARENGCKWSFKTKKLAKEKWPEMFS